MVAEAFYSTASMSVVVVVAVYARSVGVHVYVKNTIS